MTSLAMFNGREANALVEKLRQIKDRGQRVSRLAVRETVIGPSVMDAIVELLLDDSVSVDSVQLDDCGAYLNAEAASMAKALGRVHSLRLSEPTFLSQFFLDSLLQSATHLTELHIQDHFDTAQTEALARGLEINESLRVLDLSRSRLEDPIILYRGLRENHHLLELRLKSLGLNDRHMEDLLDAIRCHPTLMIIDVSFNHCRTLDHLARFLKSNTTVRKLSVGYMNVWQASKVDVKYFLESMRTNTSLTYLSLAWDKLNDHDSQFVGDMIRANSTLRSLDLRENRLSDVGIACVVDALMHNTTLRSFNIRNNSYGRDGLLALLGVVKDREYLEDIEISAKHLDIGRQIDYYMALNKGGRRYAHADMPVGIWPNIIQRVNNDDWGCRNSVARAGVHDAIFFHLRGPMLFEGVLCRSE